MTGPFILFDALSCVDYKQRLVGWLVGWFNISRSFLHCVPLQSTMPIDVLNRSSLSMCLSQQCHSPMPIQVSDSDYQRAPRDSIPQRKKRSSSWCLHLHLNQCSLSLSLWIIEHCPVALCWNIGHIEGRWIFNARVFKGYRIMTLLIYIYMYIEIANALSTPIDVDR